MSAAPRWPARSRSFGRRSRPPVASLEAGRSPSPRPPWYGWPSSSSTDRALADDGSDVRAGRQRGRGSHRRRVVRVEVLRRVVPDLEQAALAAEGVLAAVVLEDQPSGAGLLRIDGHAAYRVLVGGNRSLVGHDVNLL